MANKSSSKAAEAYYARYKTEKRWETNRMKKLMRALKRDPNNATQIELAMKSMVYRRKTPKTQVWSASKRNTAIVFKKFSGKASQELFSSNEKVSSAALAAHGNAPKVPVQMNWHSMGLLAVRAKNKDGSLVWSY
jgi:hypothetical protein